MPPSTSPREHTVPRGTLTEGTLVFTRGAADAHLHAEETPDRLFTASFVGRQPRLSVAQGTVLVRYKYGPGRSEGDIALNGAVTWAIHIRGGAARIDADLSQMRLAAVHIDGGASRVALRLPTPEGRVPIRIGGGASNLTILRPSPVPASLSIGNGAANLSFDGQRLGAVGGDIRLESSGALGSNGGFDIHIGSGASNLNIATNQSPKAEES